MPKPARKPKLSVVPDPNQARRDRERRWLTHYDEPPDPPPTLTPLGADAWRRVAAICTGFGTLAPADLPALELLAEILATEAQARAKLAIEGLSTKTKDGHKPHPALRALEAARTQAAVLLGQFKLTPGTRPRRTELEDILDGG